MDPKQLKEIKELMAAMEKTDITTIRIKDKDKYEIELRREGAIHVPHHHEMPRFMPHAPVPHHHKTPGHEEPQKEVVLDGKFITAPLVGTVYHASSPEDPPFVKVGDRVDENTVVCIIEAMKVMNEVKAGISGTVGEVLVSNGHPVEFGAKIIRIV